MSETVITTPSSGAKTTVTKQLNGSHFLGLEHAARAMLSVVIPAVVLLGLASAFELWAGTTGAITLLTYPAISASIVQPAAYIAVSIATALVIFSGLFWVLVQRVDNELQRRPDFKQRLAYKAPLNIAFGISATILLLILTDSVAVVLNSLTLIGVNGVNIGDLYLTRFLPEVIGMLVVGGGAWYQFKLLKGINKSKQFVVIAMAISAVLAVALIITAASVVHSNNTRTFPQPGSSNFYDLPRSTNLNGEGSY